MTAPKVGHNSGGVDPSRLQSIVSRIEKLEDERTAIGGDIKEIYSEAKSAGYDTKVLRQAIRIRKMDKADRAEQEELLDLYLAALS